jgi:hypothetical protein
MASAKHCKDRKCRGVMEKTDEHFEQARRGPIAGWDVTVYTCTKCGSTHEKRNSVD